MKPKTQPEESPVLDGDFDSNPFEGILSQLQSRQAGGIMGGMGSMGGAGGEQPAAPPQQAMMPMMQGGAKGKPPENQLMPGQGGGNGQFLLGGMQQLQRYIVGEDDPNNITIARSIIALLTKLLQKEQEDQLAQLPQDEQMLSQGQMQAEPQGGPQAPPQEQPQAPQE